MDRGEVDRGHLNGRDGATARTGFPMFSSTPMLASTEGDPRRTEAGGIPFDAAPNDEMGATFQVIAAHAGDALAAGAER